jgi:hypothetical protein
LVEGLDKFSNIFLVKTLLPFFQLLILEIQEEDVQGSYPAEIELFNPILVNAGNFLPLAQNLH